MTDTGGNINEDTSPQLALAHDTDQRANSFASRVAQLHIDDIIIGTRRRSVDPEAVATLADSMKTIGLQTPIAVREEVHDADTGAGHTHYYLVAGAHRLEAARKLGWAKIECCIVSCTETEAQLREIAENLHRKELTVIEFSNQTNEWVTLTKAKTGQVVQKSGAGRPEGGISAAARSLPIPVATEDARRKTVERALKIAGIKPAAKKAATEAGLDDNQAALLKISKEATKEAQIQKIKELTKAKARTTTKKRKKEKRSERQGNQADVGKREAVPPTAHPTCAEDARQAKDLVDAGCDIKPDDIIIAPGTASANAQPAQYALFRMDGLPVEIRQNIVFRLTPLLEKNHTPLLFIELPKKPTEPGASS